MSHAVELPEVKLRVCSDINHEEGLKSRREQCRRISGRGMPMVYHPALAFIQMEKIPFDIRGKHSKPPLGDAQTLRLRVSDDANVS